MADAPQGKVEQLPSGLFRPRLVKDGRLAPLGEHDVKEVAEAAYDVGKLRLAIDLGLPYEKLKLHRPLELYMGHPTWHQLAALPTDEVYSLLAGGLAEDFVPQGSATKRQRRAPAAQGTAVSGQRAEPGQAQPRAGQVAPPTSMRWVEWPPGSGQYATAVSARVLKHRTISLSAWVRRQAFGLDPAKHRSVAVLEHAPQGDDPATKPGGEEHDWAVQVYARPSGNLDAYLKPRPGLLSQVRVGDVLAVRPRGTASAIVRLWRADTAQAAAFLQFDASLPQSGVRVRMAGAAAAAAADVAAEQQESDRGEESEEEGLMEEDEGDEGDQPEEEGCSSGGKYVEEDEGEEVEEGKPGWWGPGSSCGAHPGGAAAQRSHFFEYPVGSGQCCFRVNSALLRRCELPLPGWVRALGCPDLGGQRQGSLRFEPANGGASSHWAFNTWFSADRPCEKVKAQLPRSFREAHQLAAGDVLALRGSGACCLSYSVWRAGSAEARAFADFERSAPLVTGKRASRLIEALFDGGTAGSTPASVPAKRRLLTAGSDAQLPTPEPRHPSVAQPSRPQRDMWQAGEGLGGDGGVGSVGLPPPDLDAAAPNRRGWWQWPPGSTQCCLVLPPNIANDGRLSTPAWMRGANYLALDGRSEGTLQLVWGGEGSDGAMGAASPPAAPPLAWEWRFKTFSSPHRAANLRLYMPAEFKSDRQVAAGDVLALQRRGDLLSCQLWPAASAAARQFRTTFGSKTGAEAGAEDDCVYESGSEESSGEVETAGDGSRDGSEQGQQRQKQRPRAAAGRFAATNWCGQPGGGQRLTLSQAMASRKYVYLNVHRAIALFGRSSPGSAVPPRDITLLVNSCPHSCTLAHPKSHFRDGYFIRKGVRGVLQDLGAAAGDALLFTPAGPGAATVAIAPPQTQQGRHAEALVAGGERRVEMEGQQGGATMAGVPSFPGPQQQQQQVLPPASRARSSSGCATGPPDGGKAVAATVDGSADTALASAAAAQPAEAEQLAALTALLSTLEAEGGIPVAALASFRSSWLGLAPAQQQAHLSILQGMASLGQWHGAAVWVAGLR